MGSENDFFLSRKGKESLRQGNLPGYHLMNRCELEGFVADFHVVDFRNVYGVPLDFLIELSKRKYISELVTAELLKDAEERAKTGAQVEIRQYVAA